MAPTDTAHPTAPAAPAAGTDKPDLQSAYLHLQAQFAAQTLELQQARHAAQQLHTLVNHLPVLIGYWDQHLINRFANQAYSDWLDLQPAAIYGRPMQEVLGADLFARNRVHIDGALRGLGQRFEVELSHPRTQARRHSQVDYIPCIEDGESLGFFVLVSDVTALRDAERALLERKKLLFDSERRYRSVVTDQTEVISRLRGDGTYLFANEVFCKFFGVSLDALIGSRWAPMVHPDDVDRVRAELAQLSPDRPVVMIENRVMSGIGQVCWMQFSNRGFFHADGSLREIQSVGRDITGRKLAETELLQLNAALTTSRHALREMSARNEDRIEAERKRIAREVHDELGQLLTGLRMDILYLQMRYGALETGLDSKVAGMKLLVDQAMQGVRNVASNLRPVALDIGLLDAVRWLCAEFSKKSGVPCHFDSDLSALGPQEKKSIVVFRIVQESLTNITRYAQATHVQVRMDAAQQALRVSVIDNGVGFDIAGHSNDQSFGLLGMHERALALGGTLTIRSAPGRGTCVALCIPMDPTEMEAPP